jgi:antitoxin (DNA-binding transcriptional repressor) of toxin-antitoxin stability system
MVRATVDDITRDLAGYLRRVEAGETVLVTRADRLVAEIKPVLPRHPALRPFGLCAGEFEVPGDFDAPLPDDLLSEFDGK